VPRSRQFPAIAPGIVASACWIRSYSFEFSTLSEDGSQGFFRSFGAGLFSGSVPRLAPVGCVLTAPRLGLSSHFSARRFAGGCGSAFVSRWATAFAASRARASAKRGSIGGPNSGFDQVLAGVVRDFAHHRLLGGPVMDVVEADVFCVPRGEPQGLNDKPGAGWVERAFDQSVDYVQDRKLDELAVFEQGMEWSCMSTRCCTRVWK
jgi:hypothetical protein